MICTLCNAVALYRVGNTGYCKAHYQNAVDHRAKVSNDLNQRHGWRDNRHSQAQSYIREMWRRSRARAQKVRNG